MTNGVKIEQNWSKYNIIEVNTTKIEVIRTQNEQY